MEMSNALACRKQGKQALVAATIIQKSKMSKHTPGPWTAKAINEQTMKREFKKGDRVLVRNNDLEEWQVKEFKRVNLAHPLYLFVDTDDGAWSQCRHIDDFRTGDKVQFMTWPHRKNWQDAVYVGLATHGVDDYDHIVLPEGTQVVGATDLDCVRWHPSMPWADKEPLTLEQRVEALERKLNEQ